MKTVTGTDLAAPVRADALHGLANLRWEPGQPEDVQRLVLQAIDGVPDSWCYHFTQRLLASVMDGRKFAAAMEPVYRGVWRDWCAARCGV